MNNEIKITKKIFYKTIKLWLKMIKENKTNTKEYKDVMEFLYSCFIEYKEN